MRGPTRDDTEKQIRWALKAHNAEPVQLNIKDTKKFEPKKVGVWTEFGS